jgi:hypothetical protein
MSFLLPIVVALLRYLPKDDTMTETDTIVEFKHVPEPQQTELLNYVRQRREHITIYLSTADVKAELGRSVMDNMTLADLYPKGRQMMGDEDYLLILRDLLNLSSILDDMEQTGWVPYPSRTQFFNLYTRTYRKLLQEARKS